MKQLFYFSIIVFSLSRCSSPNRASAPAPEVSKVIDTKSPLFAENISIDPPQQVVSSSQSKETYHTTVYHPKNEAPGVAGNLPIESANGLQIKYSILLNIPIETTFDLAMLQFIEEWYGTPYRYGGNSKKGVDCSAFVNFFMSAVYGLTVPRNSKEQYKASRKIKKNSLELGDLVFFNTRGGISHVGIYLANNKFIHASASSGVTISDLSESYFAKRYIASGRVR